MSTTTFYNNQNLVGIGNVGIGTASPGTTLQVYATGTTTPLNVVTASNAAYAFITTANQGIGIGTGATQPQMQFYQSTGGNNIYLNFFGYRHTAGTNWNGIAQRIQHTVDVTNKGYIDFNPGLSTDGLAFGSGSTEVMRIVNGNVGISVTNPTSNLHMNGDIYYGTSASNKLFFNCGNSNGYLQGIYAADGSVNSDVFLSSAFNQYTATKDTGNWGPAQIQISSGNNTNGAVRFRCANTTSGALSSIPIIASITPTGLGIGTLAPTSAFHMYQGQAGFPATSGSSDANTAHRIHVSSIFVDTGVYGGGYAWIQPRLNTNFATNFGITLCPNGGNVGIGSSNPSTPLDVYTTGYGIRQTDSGGGAQVSFYTNTTAGWVGTANNYPLYFFSNSGAQQMVLNTNGNVGINTASPASLLQVAGTGATISVGGVAGWSNVLQLGNTSYNQYGSLSAYPANRFTIITAGLPGVNDLLNANGGLYVAAQGLRLTGQRLVWAGVSYESAIEIDGGLSSLGAQTNGQIRFYTGNAQRAVINEGGYVGIGTSTNINSPLTVYNPASTSTYTGTTAWGNIHLMPQGANNSWAGISFGGSSGVIQQSTQASITVDSNTSYGTNMRFNVGYFFANGALERMTILGQSGNVGIGTSNPIAGIHVRTTNQASLYIEQYSGVGNQGSGIQCWNTNIFSPTLDNQMSCGFSSLRWSVVYAVTGTINTSDARHKMNIVSSNLGLNFISNLNPISYSWIDGGTPVNDPNEVGPRPGKRTFYGFLAQDVKKTLDSMGTGDFGGWTLDDPKDPDSLQGLRYTEFISPMVKAIQELSSQVTTLSAENTDLKTRVSSLEHSLQTARVVTEGLSARLAAAGF